MSESNGGYEEAVDIIPLLTMPIKQIEDAIKEFRAELDGALARVQKEMVLITHIQRWLCQYDMALAFRNNSTEVDK